MNCADTILSRCTGVDGLQRVLGTQIQSQTQVKYSELRIPPIDVKLILSSIRLIMALHEGKC